MKKPKEEDRMERGETLRISFSSTVKELAELSITYLMAASLYRPDSDGVALAPHRLD
jgi:hypothetical protein